MRSPCAVLHGGFVDAQPLHADLLDAEVILHHHLERKLFRIEHHLVAGQILAGQRRCLVGTGRDRQGERFAGGQAESVLPFDQELLGFGDRDRRRHQARTVRRDGDAVDRRALQIAADRGGERGLAALDQRHRSAADVFGVDFRPGEIIRQMNRRLERRQFRPQHRFQTHRAEVIAERQPHPGGVDLRRQFEFIAVAVPRRRDGRLAADADFAGFRPRPRGFGQRDRPDVGFAVGHDQLVGHRRGNGEGVARNIPPGTQQPLPGVDRSRRIQAEHDQRRRSDQTGDGRPFPMPRRGDGISEVASFGLFGDVLNGRGAQRAGTRLLGFVVREFQNAQQLIADAGMLAAQ